MYIYRCFWNQPRARSKASLIWGPLTGSLSSPLTVQPCSAPSNSCTQPTSINTEQLHTIHTIAMLNAYRSVH